MSKLQLKYSSFFLLVLFLISSYSLYADRKQYEINCPELMRSGDDIFKYLRITKQQAEKVKSVVITMYSYYNTLPISAKDFPNLHRLVIKESFKIHDLKGLSDFKKIESLEIDCSFADKIYAGETNQLFYNFSEIWKLQNLKELYIDAPVFDISDSILKLRKLEKLSLTSYNLPVETILEMSQLKRIMYNHPHSIDKIEILADVYTLVHNKLNNNEEEILQQYYFSNNIKEVNKRNIAKLQFFDRDLIVNYYKINLFNKENRPNSTGKYQLYYKNGNIAVEGWYINRQRDSLWTYYDTTGTEVAYKKYRLGELSEYFNINKSIYKKDTWYYYNKYNEIVREVVQFNSGKKEITNRKIVKDTVITQDSHQIDSTIDSGYVRYSFLNIKGVQFLINHSYYNRKSCNNRNIEIYVDNPYEDNGQYTLIYLYDENENKAYMKMSVNSFYDIYFYYDLTIGKSYSIKIFNNGESQLKTKFITTVQDGEYNFNCFDLQQDSLASTIKCNCIIEKINSIDEHNDYRVFANNLCEECKKYYDDREKNLEFFQQKFKKYDDYIKILK